MMQTTNKVCDYDRIIVQDSKSLVPGYIEVTKEGIFAHFSNDSDNKTPYYEGKLLNKLTGPSGESMVEKIAIDIDPALFIDKKTKSFHFCNLDCLLSWLENNIKS